MVFSSVIFLLWFLPIFLPLYLLADRRYKNGLILIASIFFYAWGAPRFIFALLATTFIDFHLVHAMARSGSQSARRRWLWLSLGLNLALLAFFKYSNFFVDNLNTVLAGCHVATVPWTALALPLGLSFFVFESITYVVDVYRGQQQPLQRFWDYQMYILFFPKLIAGPIVRYADIAGQLSGRRDDADLFLTGFYRLVAGLAKKVLIADKLGAFAATVFAADPEALSAGQAWLGLACFALQIYFDFSGYSDMALGLGRMMGFRLPENFDNPLVSASLTEFWQRWHISLGKWMRDYLYIPLGGNRLGAGRTYLNLGLVFLATGLWHGAAWTFVLWGACHGAWLLMERWFLGRWLARAGRWVGMLVTLSVYVVFTGIFKMPGIGAMGSYAMALAGRGGGLQLPMHAENVAVILLAAVLALSPAMGAVRKLQARFYAERQSSRGHVVLLTLSLIVFLLCLSFIVWSPYSPFLYFRF